MRLPRHRSACWLLLVCILYICVCVFLIGFFIGFACVSRLQHLFFPFSFFFWGVLSSGRHYHQQLYPLRSLQSRALPLSLSGLLFWRLFVFYFVLIFLAILLSCLPILSVFFYFMMYEILIDFYGHLLWAISCIKTNCWLFGNSYERVLLCPVKSFNFSSISFEKNKSHSQ